MEAIPTSTRQKGKTPFLASPPALRTQQLVGVRSLATQRAVSTPAIGAAALLFNTADDNTAFGVAALLFNTTGIDNTAVGAAALSNNTIGAGQHRDWCVRPPFEHYRQLQYGHRL